MIVSVSGSSSTRDFLGQLETDSSQARRRKRPIVPRRTSLAMVPKLQWNFCAHICRRLYWAIRSIPYMFFQKDTDTSEDTGDSRSEFAIRPISLEILEERTKFDRTWIKDMYRIFKQECPNGRMTSEDFCTIFRRFFPKSCTNSYATRMFYALDNNGAGELSFQDLLLHLAEFRDNPDQGEKQLVYRLLNPNDENHINLDEFYEYTKSIFELHGRRKRKGVMDDEFICLVSDDQIRKRAAWAFAKLDRYNRGGITLDDFNHYFAQKTISEQMESFKVLCPPRKDEIEPETVSSLEDSVHL